ncbi:hypothetical protein KP509_17G029400 [Ceratopteris richardii]|uniref:Adenylyl-sulfate kinase n=1 Tax=Ceratopteris richardii TaxID=49495 RepID=A0A8T2SVI6_CERRI|nr:hypothetical protein KP509_17G029400 [Ceratopteris richardii]
MICSISSRCSLQSPSIPWPWRASGNKCPGSRLYSNRRSLTASISACRVIPTLKDLSKLDFGKNLCGRSWVTISSAKAESMSSKENGANSVTERSEEMDSHTVEEQDKTSNACSKGNVTTSRPGFQCDSVTTVGKSTNIVWHECMVKKEDKQKLLGQRGCVVWITGLSGSGKSTLAYTLDHALLKRGNLSYVIDGDNLRHGLNKNLGFSPEDRTENIRRFGEVARLFTDAGVICIASVISPYRKDRDACRQLVGPGEFIEVYMNFPVSLCEERDPKGLYRLARAGKIKVSFQVLLVWMIHMRHL